MKTTLYTFMVSISLLAAACTEKPEPEPTPQPDPEGLVLQNGHLVLKKSDVQDYDKYFLPVDTGLGIPKTKEEMLNSNSRWSFVRSKQSEHFIVFWDKPYGEFGLYGKQVGKEDAWPSTEKNSVYRVDIDDLLAKAEQFFDTNVNKLKMAEIGKGKSNLDKYKMQIYLMYQTEWNATGAGYADTIGALWLSPGTAQPVGSTVAHEIGHSFQYQVYADKLLQGQANDYKSGFRYGFGSNGDGGNGYWEQCAQWQSFQDYPKEALDTYHFDVWIANYHRHFHHEWMRYASYYFQYWMTGKHGIETYGRIWKDSRYPEDAIMAYNRTVNDGDWEQTRSDLYEYASHAVTFDFPGTRDNVAERHLNRYKTSLIEVEDGWRQVAYSSCPGSTGFNVIRLGIPSEGKVTAHFKGLSSNSELAQGDGGQYMESEKVAGTRTRYNGTVTDEELGWRYGFVAMESNGNRHYSESFSAKEGIAEYEVPANTKYLYFVVQGAPQTYAPCPWDEKEVTDQQFPYMVKFEGAELFGSVTIDPGKEPQDVSFEYDLTYQSSLTDYQQGTINLADSGDLAKLCQAFSMQPDVLASKTKAIASGSNGSVSEGMVTFGLMQPDGSIKYDYSANVGFYITKDGNVGSWGNNDPVFVEYDKDGFVLTYGHKPGASVSGAKYVVKPCLTYMKGGKTYKAVFTLNISVK